MHTKDYVKIITFNTKMQKIPFIKIFRKTKKMKIDCEDCNTYLTLFNLKKLVNKFINFNIYLSLYIKCFKVIINYISDK